MRLKKFAQLYTNKERKFFSTQIFCPFLLLIYDKEAGKNFSYSDTFNEINSFLSFIN